MKQPYTVTLRERDTLKQIRAKVTAALEPLAFIVVRSLA